MSLRGARPPGGRTCAALYNAAAPPPPPVSPSMRWAARLLASSLLQAAEAMSSMDLSSYTCGDLTMAREFNFVSPGFPVSIGHDSLACSLSIDHGCGGRAADPASDQAVCQLRLDFDEFSIQPPLLGNCIFDMFYVGANGKYPLVCGDNSGHHLYLNVEGRATTELTFILSQLQDSASKSSIRRFVITEKAPTRAFSWLKMATTAFTFKTLLRHY